MILKMFIYKHFRSVIYTVCTIYLEAVWESNNYLSKLIVHVFQFQRNACKFESIGKTREALIAVTVW